MTNKPAPGPIKSGRPRAKSNENKPKFYETRLYALLLTALPQHVEGGRLSPKSISVAIEMHKFTVYKWLTGNFVSPKGARALIKESGGKLKPQDLAPYLIS
jgi:hypothetical protein